MDPATIDAAELTSMFALEARLMDDVANPGRVPIDGVYLMTYGTHYEEAIMTAARTRSPGAKILYCGEPPASSFLGGDAWRQRLSTFAAEEDLVPVLGSMYQDLKNGPMINSFSEARPVITKALELGMKNIEVLALPFHIQRCFVGFATECLAIGAPLNIFARITGHISWTEVSVQSQGIQRGTPIEFSAVEITKILSYKNLASPAEVLRYLDERDARVASQLSS